MSNEAYMTRLTQLLPPLIRSSAKSVLLEIKAWLTKLAYCITNNRHEKLNYIEFPASDLTATKAFFQQAFHWRFTDYGTDYIVFDYQGIDGGFFKSSFCSTVDKGGALAIFFSKNLEATASKITLAGGEISKPVFSFPGGRRFHFIEPSGNEFAVWSDK